MTHPSLVKGVGLGPRSKETIDREWNNLASRLNAHGNGAKKTGQRWKRYWADIKHKSKTRLAKRRRDALENGCGPSCEDEFSETEKKILAIIGEQVVFGDSEHRVPFITKLETPEEENSQDIYLTDNITEEVPVTMASPSTRGQTCMLYTDPLSAKMDSETSILEQSPDYPQKRHRPSISNTTVQSRVDLEWIKDLESRKIEVENKLAEAALIMAESSRTQAEVAKVQADMMQTLVDLVRVQNQNINSLTELIREKAGAKSSQNPETNPEINPVSIN